MQEIWVRYLGQEYPLEKEMATYSGTLAWKIPWTGKPCRLQSMGLQTVGHDWATSLFVVEHLGNSWVLAAVNKVAVTIPVWGFFLNIYIYIYTYFHLFCEWNLWIIEKVLFNIIRNNHSGCIILSPLCIGVNWLYILDSMRLSFQF